MTGDAMTLRDHIADVLDDRNFDTQPTDYDLADALLASPELAAIIDLAAWAEYGVPYEDRCEPYPGHTYAVSMLLAAWRAER